MPNKDPYMSHNEFKKGFYDQKKDPITPKTYYGTASGKTMFEEPIVSPDDYMLTFKTGGGATKPGLWVNINRRKRLGISRPKSETTISKEAYSNMKKGFPKKAKGGSVMASGSRLGRSRPTKLY